MRLAITASSSNRSDFGCRAVTAWAPCYSRREHNLCFCERGLVRVFEDAQEQCVSTYVICKQAEQ